MNDLQALVSAILGADLPQVRAILRATPDVVNLQTGNKQSPLKLAKDKGHKAIEAAIARHLGAAHGYSGAALQRLLVDYLHEVSEEYFAAGWMDHLEFEVWGLVKGATLGSRAAFRYAHMNPEHLADLAFLARQTRCWATWPEGEANPRAVPLPEWEALYQAWRKAEPLS